MTTNLIGYARCSTDKQDLTLQKAALENPGVAAGRIYTDHGLPRPTEVVPATAHLDHDPGNDEARHLEVFPQRCDILHDEDEHHRRK